MAPGLHRMDADGTHVEQLTNSPVSEFCPVVLDDGRVMYHRWEYIDKGARVGKTIWTMNPDGTRPQELYGVADDTTTVYMYPQPLPGNDHRLVCVGTCHFPQGGCLGAIMLVDYGKGVRVRGPDPERSRTTSRATTAIPSPTSRRTCSSSGGRNPGWHFLTADGKYVHDREGQQRAPVHASVSRQRSRVPGLLQGQSDRSLQGSAQRLRPVPDRHRGAPSAGPSRRAALLLASAAAGRAARAAQRADRCAIRSTPPATRPSAS